MKRVLSILALITFALCSHAQQLSFKDTIDAYNKQRIHTNKKGMTVLTTWGCLNVAAGGVGYFTARSDEWKYFHGMNALWGAVNAGIGFMGLAGVRKEEAAKMSYQQSYNRYLSNKRIYLINAGLDILYIGGGVGLTALGSTAKTNADVYRGFGKSFVVQGVFLLFFDNIMFASHLRSNSKWYQIMSEIRVTGNGVGFTHSF